MTPRKGGPPPDNTGKRGRALDRAVRKVEEKEARQDAKSGKAGKPVNSVGRHIRRGWTEGA